MEKLQKWTKKKIEMIKNVKNISVVVVLVLVFAFWCFVVFRFLFFSHGKNKKQKYEKNQVKHFCCVGMLHFWFCCGKLFFFFLNHQKKKTICCGRFLLCGMWMLFLVAMWQKHFLFLFFFKIHLNCEICFFDGCSFLHGKQNTWF